MNISTVTIDDFLDAEPKLMASMTYNRSGKRTLSYTPNLINGTIRFTVIATNVPHVGSPRVEMANREFVTLEAAIEFFNQIA